jgi:hypothetical protein
LRSEHRAAHDEFFKICKQGLLEISERKNIAERMNPSANQATPPPLIHAKP